MDKMRSMEFFLAACEGGSFAAAARACATDPSTVSKALSRLESQLGFSLFQRSTRKLRITPEGKLYARAVRSMMQDLSACELELKQSNDSPSGLLRISAGVCYGHLYVRPLLPAFCQRFPDIQIELELNDLHVDVIDQGIDLALRTGFVKDSRLVARRLSPMDFLTCVAPHYLDAHGTPRCADDYRQHQWIGFRIKETLQLQPILLPDDGGVYQPFELERTHVTDDGEAMAQMCVDGMGFAQLPHFLAKQGLNSGALVSMYPHLALEEPDSGVFAIYPKREYLPAKVRVFIDHLTAALAAMGETPNRTWAQDCDSLF